MSGNKCLGLVGNPNCGKTTLFNGLTGLKQKTANWPGVTVERSEGKTLFQAEWLNLIDLPGTYSLSTYTLEERVTKASLLDGTVDVIINVLDASAMERSLYLTWQLLALKRPMVVALNMMDVVNQRGMTIDIGKLSEHLGGIPIVPISARRQAGFSELLKTALAAAEAGPQEKPVTKNLAAASDLDIYNYIEDILADCISGGEIKDSLTDRIDNILLHPVLGIPIFLVLMAGVFLFTFWAGDFIKGYLELMLAGFSNLARGGLIKAGLSLWLVNLIVDGIIQGVGGVLTFLPNILFLFIALGFLESCGYMARAAYVMDEVMGLAGLSGKAFLPMLLGFGCTVPAVMATRSLTSMAERKKTIFILPFMSCSARIPIYVLFSGIFFPESAMLTAFSMYLLGLLVAIAAAAAYSRIIKADKKPVLFIELPEYRMPDLKGIVIYVWDKVKEYISKAGTVIFAASVILWFLLNYNLGGQVSHISQSFGAAVSRLLVPVFRPAGLGYWQMIAALISGLSAKEVVVSSLYILYGAGSGTGDTGMTLAQLLMADGFTKINSYAFMVFCLLYSPCIAAISTIKKELSSVKWTLGLVSFQCGLAWLAAVIVYQVGSRLF